MHFPASEEGDEELIAVTDGEGSVRIVLGG
jgi:hypothetical protein